MTTVEAQNPHDSNPPPSGSVLHGDEHVSMRLADERVSVRLVEEHDLGVLEVLDKEVFRDLAYSKHYLRTFFNLFRKTWYVVDRDGDLAGYALIGPDSDNREAWLLGLAVSERHQGNGLGRELMQKAVKVMEGLGVADGFITVRPDNEAAFHLYASFGFRQDGEDREDYYGNGERRKVLRRCFEEERAQA